MWSNTQPLNYWKGFLRIQFPNATLWLFGNSYRQTVHHTCTYAYSVKLRLWHRDAMIISNSWKILSHALTDYISGKESLNHVVLYAWIPNIIGEQGMVLHGYIHRHNFYISACLNLHHNAQGHGLLVKQDTQHALLKASRNVHFP